MADEAAWVRIANEHEGMLLVWVDQSKDTEIKKVNIGGVCFALCKDFIQASLRGFTALTEFCQPIFNLGRISTNRIPRKYVMEQIAVTVLRRSFVLNAETIVRLIEEAKEEPARKKLREELQEVLALMNQTMYGPNQQITKGDNVFKIAGQVNAAFDERDTDCACLVEFSFVGRDSGHAVAFTHAVEGEFTYRFLDPNLGVFCFNEFDDLDDFFDKVLVTYRDNKATPDKYTIITYGP